MSNNTTIDDTIVAWIKRMDKKRYVELLAAVGTSKLAIMNAFLDLLKDRKDSLNDSISNPLFLIIPFAILSTLFIVFLIWGAIRLLPRPQPIAGMNREEKKAFSAIKPAKNYSKHEPGYLCLMADSLAWGLYNKKTRSVEIQKQWKHQEIAKIKLVKQALSYAYTLLVFTDGSQKIFRVSNAEKFKEALKSIGS